MKHYLGISEYSHRQKKEVVKAHYDPSRLINAHMLLCGMSGTGKSFQSMRFLESAALADLEVDIIDVHDELHETPRASAVKFSQATGYGYNPLVLNTDPDTGGVNRQIDFVVSLVKDKTAQFGAKQEYVLRSLLKDTYAANGIFPDNPRSWVRQRITEAEHRELIAQRKWSELRNYYPTLDDLLSFANRKVMALTIGGDQKAVSAYEALSRTMGRLRSINSKYSKAADDTEIKRLETQAEELRAKCIESYTNFVSNLKTGREIEDILKYDSVEVLKGVIGRIELLNSAGIFRSNEPPFNSKVRCYQIKSLSTEQQISLTRTRLREIFEKNKMLGKTDQLRHVIFLDEGHIFFSDEPDDIINVIAKEARKFGIGLWCASQQPTQFPEDFLTNVGATVLLGIHPNYWKRSASLLRISEETLKFIRPKEIMSIKLMQEGKADPPFNNIIVPNPKSADGLLAMNPN